jgi:hypothetical protein
MDELLKFLVIWGGIDVVVVATGLYLGNVIRIHFPNWWKQVICDEGPDVEPELEGTALPLPMKPTATHHR